jgi:hypothetical protein
VIVYGLLAVGYWQRLDDTEWRMINAQLTSVHPFWADSLVRARLLRVAPETAGAPVYRRTAAGRVASSVEIRAGSPDDAQPPRPARVRLIVW